MRLTHDRTLALTSKFSMINLSVEAHRRAQTYYPEDRPSYGQLYRDLVNEYFSNSTHFGCYPIIFMDDHANLFCHSCAKKVFLDERTDITMDVYYEGPDYHCDECNSTISSAYGDPEEQDQ